MINKKPAYIFVLFVFLALFFEAIGIDNDKYIPFFLILVSPFVYIFLSPKNSVYKFPRVMLLLFSFLIIRTFTSFVFSGSKQVSFESALIFISYFFCFIIILNAKKYLLWPFIKTLLFVSAVIATTALLYTASSLFANPLYPIQHGSQLIFAVYNGHSHLGDFLLIPIVFLLTLMVFRKRKQKKVYMYLGVCFALLFLSFSRSAYVALGVSLLLLLAASRKTFSKKTLRKPFMYLFFVIPFFVAIFLFFATVSEFSYQPGIAQIQSLISPLVKAQDKTFFASRLPYFQQAVQSIINRPFVGYGLNNYVQASFQVKSDSSLSSTSHNIFLDMFVEAGVFSGFVFLSIILLFVVSAVRVLTKSPKDNNVFMTGVSLAFLAVLINFQTDYTFKIYSFLLIFFILAGFFYEEKTYLLVSRRLLLFPSGILAVFAVLIAISSFINQHGQYKTAIAIYPLNTKAYQPAIRYEDILNRTQSSLKLAQNYERIASGIPHALRFLALWYEKNEDYDKAASLWSKNLQEGAFEEFTFLEHAYDVIASTYGKQHAEQLISSYLDRVSRNKMNPVYIPPEQIGQVVSFCKKVSLSLCHEFQLPRYKYMYEPKANSLEHPNPDIPHSKAQNTINSDRLNERFDYSVEKPSGTYRILTVGGSTVYGLYVDTKDNWTELLEDELNRTNTCPSFEKVEVINLGMHGYDPEYAAERLLYRGLKYNPDLVIWFIDNGDLTLYREKMGEAMEESKTSKDFVEFKKTYTGIYPEWQYAADKVTETVSYEGIVSHEVEQITNMVNANPHIKFLFLSFTSLTSNQKQKLLDLADKYGNVWYEQIPEIDFEDARFPDSLLNQFGHLEATNKIQKQLQLNSCYSNTSKFQPIDPKTIKLTDRTLE